VNKKLAPTYQMLIGDYWLLWYLASNSYSVVDNSFKVTLDHYFASSSIHSFKHAIGSHHSIDEIDSLNDSVETYLNNCNISLKKLDLSATDIDVTQRLIVRHYRINKQVIQIHFSSVSILNLIHPAIAHLSVKTSNTAATHFDIYIKDDQLYLFKDKRLVTAVPKKITISSRANSLCNYCAPYTKMKKKIGLVRFTVPQ
jgi:hypothetical protein